MSTPQPTTIIDFSTITTNDDFYVQLRQNWSDLPSYFGDNLDALFDVLTDVAPAKPLQLDLINVNSGHKATLVGLFGVLDDAMADCTPNTFTYRILNSDVEANHD